MQSDSYQKDKDMVFAEMGIRYKTLKETLRQYAGKYDLLKPYPFNSGYFMDVDDIVHGDLAHRNIHSDFRCARSPWTISSTSMPIVAG